MPKICDPPPFIGGQNPIIEYVFTFTQTCVSSGWGENHFSGTNTREVLRTDLGNWISGKIISIEQGVFNNFSIFKVTNDKGVSVIARTSGSDYQYYFGGYGGVYTIYSYSNIKFFPINNSIDTTGDPPSTNCICSADSCRVDCATSPNGFCCIDHSVTNRLLQVFESL